MIQKSFVSILLILFCIFGFVSTNAQSKAEARYKGAKMIEISDLLSYEEIGNCESRRYFGSIVAVQNKAGKQIDSFTLKTAKGTIKIYLSPAVYAERLTDNDMKNLPSLIAAKNKITVDSYICGASGKIILAIYIALGNQGNPLG